LPKSQDFANASMNIIGMNVVMLLLQKKTVARLQYFCRNTHLATATLSSSGNNHAQENPDSHLFDCDGLCSKKELDRCFSSNSNMHTVD
jgi:hypothetical protein